MNFRIILLISGFFFLFIFYLFSWQVKKERFKQINFDTTVRLQHKIPQRLDSYWEDITFFVEPIPSIVFVGLLTLAALIDIKKKKFRPFALMIPLLFGLLVLAEVYGKARVESPAPPFFMIKNPIAHFPKYHVQEDYSFPSGHAARSLFFAQVATLVFYQNTKNHTKTLLFFFISSCFSLLVSVGKVYLGQHWLSDIIGGYLVALAFSSFAGTFLWKKNVSISVLKKAIDQYPQKSKQKKLRDIVEDDA